MSLDQGAHCGSTWGSEVGCGNAVVI